MNKCTTWTRGPFLFAQRHAEKGRKGRERGERERERGEREEGITRCCCNSSSSNTYPYFLKATQAHMRHVFSLSLSILSLSLSLAHIMQQQLHATYWGYVTPAKRTLYTLIGPFSLSPPSRHRQQRTAKKPLAAAIRISSTVHTESVTAATTTTVATTTEAQKSPSFFLAPSSLPPLSLEGG